MELTRVVILMVLSITLPLLVQLYDKRTLSDDARQRSWNIASWAAALYAFGPLSMLGWYWVSRRGWRRCIYGALSTGALLLLLSLVDQVLTFLLAMKPKPLADIPRLLLEVGALTVGGGLLLVLMEGFSRLLRWRRGDALSFPPPQPWKRTDRAQTPSLL